MQIEIDGQELDVGEDAIEASTLLSQLSRSTEPSSPELACDLAAFQAWLVGPASSCSLPASQILTVIAVRHAFTWYINATASQLLL